MTQSDHSIFTNILVGIAGSFVGGVLASILNISVFGFFRTLVSATIRPHSDSLYMASGVSSASNYLIDVAGGE